MLIITYSFTFLNFIPSATLQKTLNIQNTPLVHIFRKACNGRILRERNTRLRIRKASNICQRCDIDFDFIFFEIAEFVYILKVK